MILIVCMASGLALGCLLGTIRHGLVTIAAVASGSMVVQIWQLVASGDRASLTLLPVIVGAVVVAFLLLGALARRRLRHNAKAV